jgi:S-layer family protein
MRARLRSRSFVILLATAVIVALGATVVVASHDFSDVPTGAFYHDSVSWLVDRNITAGCGSGKYCPNNAVTRGQMAVFLDKLGDVFTPVRRNINGSVNALDLDADPDVCKETSNYTPSYPQQALFFGKVSVVSAAAAPTVSYWAYPAYSTDGGTTWTTLNAGTDAYSSESQSAAAGIDAANPVTGFLNLNAGTNYRFGITITGQDDTTGDATADTATGGWCNLVTLIFNRQT